MPKFGKRSLNVLATLHPDWQMILKKVINILDMTLIQGYRGQEEQDEYYAKGLSQLKYPESNHNITDKDGNPCSEAVDMMLYHRDKPHIRWDAKFEASVVAGIVIGIAFENGIMVRWGGDWSMDLQENESFIDRPHFELHKKLIDGKWKFYKDLRNSPNAIA